MTENPTVPFPNSPYCQVRARVASIWADGPDDGDHPDWRPAVGEKVALTPSINSQLLTYDVGGDDPIIVTVERVDCVVGADGFLTKSDGRPVFIASTDDPQLSATGWTWNATIKGKTIAFSAPAGGVVDLAMFIAAPATNNTKEWVERIPELVALIEASTDPAEIATIVEDYLAANPLSPTPDATTATKGILQLAGDLGGTADAPTVPGLIDLSDRVDWIEQNGDFLVESIPLDEPGDSYDIPSRWKVTNLRAGADGAVLNTNYGERVLGPSEWASHTEWAGQVRSLYGTLTLVSGSISYGTAQYEDRLYTPHSHLSTWNPHPEYAFVEDLPAIIVGPGRPDIPSTTNWTITGSEPVGAEYRSTDGAGVGAWVWMKRPTGWVVTDGDTGPRVITHADYDGTLVIGRDAHGLYAASRDLRPTKTGTLIVTLTAGFRVNSSLSNTAGYPIVGDNGDVFGKITTWDAGLLEVKIRQISSRIAFLYRNNFMIDPWPTTLPGTPA